MNDYLGKMQKIQRILSEYLDKEDTSEDEDQPIKFNFFDDISNDEKPTIMKETFLMITHIFNFHKHSYNFKEKIEHIILFYKDAIKQTFSNRYIFNIFKSSKLLLLFLFKEKIIDIDGQIANLLKKFPNNEFFSKEINSFYGKEASYDDEFEKKRQIGENDNQLCEIIRNDSIDEFITYIHQNSINLTGTIQPSIFETHPYLIDKDVSLIDYSAFFGSIRIFKYLQANNVQPERSTWISSIHSKNTEIINMMEEIEPNNEFLYYDCFVESIKCHHIEISNYFEDNYFQKENNDYLLKDIIPSYNFIYFKEGNNYQKYLPNLIKFNYISIVKMVLNNVDIFHKLFSCYKFTYDDLDEEFRQQTLFSISIIYENIEILEHLLKFSQGIAGGKIEINNKIEPCYYTSAKMIYYAVETDNFEIVEIMCKNNCFAEYDGLHDYYSTDVIYDKDADGDDETICIDEAKTVLTTACENNNKEIVELLLNTGKVNINLPHTCSKGLGMGECEPVIFYEMMKTPLSIAVENGNKEIVELLLDRSKIKLDDCYMLKNIDLMQLKVRDAYHFYYKYPPDNESTKYLSALDLAKRNGYDEIYNLLLNKKQY